MSTGMIDQGMYDAVEVARLVGHSVEWVVGLSTDSTHGPAPVPPSFERMFSFLDLISLDFAALLRGRGVSDRALRAGMKMLRGATSERWPLASKPIIDRLATSGESFLGDLDGHGYVDIGMSGQGVIQEVVALNLRGLEFNESGRPSMMRPARLIKVDPLIQAGAPCIDGTRIPTSAIAELLLDEDEEDVALDFELTVEEVRAAAAFEDLLDRGVGIAA